MGYSKYRYLNTDVHVYEQTNEKVRLLQVSKPSVLSKIASNEGAILSIINCSYFTSGYVLGRSQGDMFNGTHDQEGFYDLVFLKNGSYKIGAFKSWDYCDANEVLAGFSVATILVENGSDCEKYSKAIVDKSKISSKNPQTAVAVTKKGKVILIVSEGRNSNDTGLTGYQVRDFIKSKYDIELLVQLDGGGSSEMIVDRTIKSYLSDGSERKMWNGLALLETEKKDDTGSDDTTDDCAKIIEQKNVEIIKLEAELDKAQAKLDEIEKILKR